MQTTDALNDDAIDFTNELFGDYDLDMYIIDEGNVHNNFFLGILTGIKIGFGLMKRW